MKKYEIIICTVICILLTILFLQVGTGRFNREEAKGAIGDIEYLHDNWHVTRGDGRDEIISIPKSFLQNEGKLVLTHSMKKKDAGKALSVLAINANINIYVTGQQIYKSGSARGLTSEENPTTLKNDTGYDTGEIIINIPDNVDDGDVLRINLEGDNKNSYMLLNEVGVSERDTAVVNVVRNSTFPVICAVLIIISAAILLGLDVIRVLDNARTRGLIIIAVLALDTIFYNFVRTNLFYLFYANRRFYSDLVEVSYIMMPVFISAFFFRGFKIHFPVAVRVLFYASTAVAALDMTTYPLWGRYYGTISWLNTIWKLALLITYMIILVKWKQLRPQSRQIGMDEAALVCLIISIMGYSLSLYFTHTNYLNMITIAASTAYFIFMDVQHIQIILAERKYRAEARARDLEERNKKLEIARSEAEEAKTEAILANEAKSRFLANMSHEIRTPINAVLGMDEMIIRQSNDENIRDYAFDIRSAGRTLLSLINDILDFSKIESGKMEIVPVEYEFSQMVDDLVNMIQTRAADKGLDFELEIDEAIPSHLIGDDVRIRQCITNLLTNAVKYTKEGSMYLRIRLADIGKEKCTLHIEVEDTGIGIKEEDIPKLFQEYERIEESRNRNIEGTGLGINITMQMLGLMKTRLEVKSVYGQGSVFYFDLVQKIADPTPVGDITVKSHGDAKVIESTHTFIAPDAHVLVVDDNDMNRKVFISLLKSTRIQIDDANSGPAAVELAANNHYDMIFMDHMMPDMDGIEAMKAIKALEDSPNANTPIYVLTANAVSGAREMYLEEGFDGFLSKPIMTDKLKEALRERLPDELLLPAPDGEETAESNTSDMPEDLPTVDGLDWPFAWLHLPSEEMLSDSVRQFYDLIDVQADKLDTMYRELPGQAAMEAYRIQVHGMKSLAATVGIVPLAGMAKVLEFAARDENEEIINSTHKVFIDEWRSYSKKLIGVFGIEDPEVLKQGLPEADYEFTMAALDLLREAMDEFDIDTGDELVSKLKEFRYPKNIDDIISALAGAVADLDNDRVSELVEQVKGEGEWE